MKHAGTLIEGLLKKYNLWSGYQKQLILQDWESIVGNSLSSVSRAESIVGERLKVVVKDSVWSYHLSLMKPVLIKKANDYVGRVIIKDIHFEISSGDD